VPLPDPFPGLVLNYSYLWHDQHRKGMEEGVKDRPCVVVLSVAREHGETVVTVAPVTHIAPRFPGEAIEIPAVTKARLGLDHQRSWVVIGEVNRFLWPGHDLRPISGSGRALYDYGVLPPRLFRQIRDGIVHMAHLQKVKMVPR
jgi:hypothetical protein